MINAKVFALGLLAGSLLLAVGRVAAQPAPVVTCPPDFYNASSLDVTCGYVVPPGAIDPTVVGGDANTLVVQTLGFEENSLWPVGCTAAQFVVYDSFTGEPVAPPCNLQVCIEDNTPPTLVCPPDQTVIIPIGETTTQLQFNPAAAYDNCCEICAVQIAGEPNGSIVGIGEISNVFQATDAAGNVATCTQIIDVVGET